MSPAPTPSFPPGVDPRQAPGADEAVEPAAAMRPAVAAASAAQAPWLVGGGSVLLGLVAFLWLSSHRTHAVPPLPPPSQAADVAAVAAPPPPPDVDAMQAAARNAPAAPPPTPAVALVTPPPAPAPVANPPQPTSARPPPPEPGAHAPVLVVDLPGSDTGGPGGGNAAAGRDSAGRPGGAGLNADEQFAARIESGPAPDRTQATRLTDPSSIAPQGTIIPAVLETALNSDLPGFARAVVSRDVRSFDGSTVLIPRGSRVIGEYKSAVALGQSRIFVVWTRILRPDGGSIQIGSGGGDTLGRAGLAGKVDRHFFEQFSGAVLLTVLNAAAYAAATAASGTPSTIVSIGSSGGGAGLGGAAGGLTSTPIPPTIKVAQGTPIRIFVQRDLDFAPVGGTGR